MTANTSTKVSATATKPSKAQKQEATQEQLDALISAVQTGIKGIVAQSGKYEEAVSVAQALADARNDARVITARALVKLGAHPSAQRGGKPALATIATLVGTPRNTLRPLWECAVALTEKKWAGRTNAPTAGERALAASFYAEKVQLKQESNDKLAAEGKGPKADKSAPNTKQVKKITATLEGVVEASDILDKTVAAFTKDQGLTTAQFTALQTKLNNIIAALEAVTK